MPTSKRLGHIMPFAVFDVNKKVSEHMSLTAAKKKQRENVMRYRVRRWNDETKHWIEVR